MIRMIGSFALLFTLFAIVAAQPPRKNGDGTENLKPLPPGDDGSPKGPESCSSTFRTFDGRCNNIFRKEWGSARQVLFSYYRRHSSKVPTLKHYPSTRFISNVMCKQDTDVWSKRGLSELVTFFGQFLDHNIVATSTDKNERMDIPIPKNDPIFRNFSGKLHFERSERSAVFEEKGWKRGEERPMNSLSSYVDLAAVYGADDVRHKSLRTFKDGKLLTSAGNMLPFNTDGLFNAPSSSNKFFLAGDHRANEHPVLTAIHTIFVREHNLICDEIKKAYGDWDDETMFQTARHINIAQFQKIVFEEFYPAMTGRKLGKYRGYRAGVNAGVSVIFSTAGFRVGHTMVGNSITRRAKSMAPMPSIPMKDMFFQGPGVMSQGVEPFIRGACFGRAQEVDVHVHDTLRNFLFDRIPEENGFDLIALNLQRSRDHGVPTLNNLRGLFKLKRLRNFASITRNRALQSKLANAYHVATNVEAWIGMMAEDHIPKASMGPTMFLMWQREFRRLRDGDRFYFRKPGVLSAELENKIPRVKALFTEKELLRAIILRTTDITPSEIPGSVWMAIDK